MGQKGSRPVAVLGALLLALGCADGMAPGEQVRGQWGTIADPTPANFSATGDSAVLRFRCGAARFAGPIMVEADGQFRAIGEYGGEGWVAPAELRGATTGSSLTLSLTADGVVLADQIVVRSGLNPSWRNPICLAASESPPNQGLLLTRAPAPSALALIW